MQRILLLLFAPAIVYGFDSSFNYGCQNGKCTFQLVVPKEVAQYIDENALSSEVGTISASLTKLQTTITNFSDAGASNFSTAFNANYDPVNTQAQSLNSSVNIAVNNATDLLNASNSSIVISQSLYNSIACFQGNANSSYTCFSPPTTAAPPTTQAASTTGNPSTGDMSTVTGGSTGVPVSTVPFTGSTGVPVTGGSTGAPGSTSAPASDSSSPSTSAGSSDTTPAGGATSTGADVSTSTDSSSASNPI